MFVRASDCSKWLLADVAAAGGSTSSAGFNAGAGRRCLPHAAVSASLVLLLVYTPNAGHASVLCEGREGSRASTAFTPAAAAEFWAAVNSAGPVLLRVLSPLSQQLRSQTDAGGAGCVLSAVQSPADVAAALNAALTALYGSVSEALTRQPSEATAATSSLPMPMLGDGISAMLLATCAEIISALAAWLSSDEASSGSSSAGGKAQGSTAGVAAREVWRYVLHEFKLPTALLQASSMA